MIVRKNALNSVNILPDPDFSDATNRNVRYAGISNAFLQCLESFLESSFILFSLKCNCCFWILYQFSTVLPFLLIALSLFLFLCYYFFLCAAISHRCSKTSFAGISSCLCAIVTSGCSAIYFWKIQLIVAPRTILLR